MPSFGPPAESTAPRSLAAAGLPARVRKTLELALALVSEELDASLAVMLDEFEQELFRLASQAGNHSRESSYMQNLRVFRLNRSDLVPHFMLGLEASLAAIRTPAPASATLSYDGTVTSSFGKLSLVDDTVMDEGTVLREIAIRQEGRANLPLHLLGQRFGVLAASPAFDAERLPLGPQALCRAMRSASHALDIEHDSRLLLYRLFDRHVMSGYWRVLEQLDELLDRGGILAGLTHVPTRVRPSVPAPPEAAAAAANRRPGNTSAGSAAAGTRSAEAPWRPHTAWMGEPVEVDGKDERASAERLQQLLANRRELLGKLRPGGRSAGPKRQISTREIVSSLGELLRQPPSTPGGPPTLADIRQMLLAQARQRNGVGADLSPQDNDTFELLEMLYTHIGEEIRKDVPAAGLVQRLQVPLLRVALQDRAFFVRDAHPARELLGTVAERAAKWLDDGDSDPRVMQSLQAAVNYVIEHHDDPEAFAVSNRELQAQLQAQVRKAEMLERRHAEAARGKEKLEIAKLRASEVMDELMRDQRIPRFTRALLNQAWADVLTLTLLRQGEDSEAWEKQLETTRQIIDSCQRDHAEADAGLVDHVSSSLAQVGYHGDEAAAIGQRLTSNVSEEEPASRTELAMKIKSRVRLGDEAHAARPKPPPRTPEQQAYHDQLRNLPFGTWIEFITNQRGDVVRRRLSWFSPVTDNALFVNQRGQRTGEQSLDSIARMMAAGQAKIVTVERGRLIDRAWASAINTLRSFAGIGEDTSPLPRGAT